MPVPAGTYLLTLGQLVVSDDVSIAGAGQTNTIIDGNATDRVILLDSVSGVVEISDVTIRNGNTPSGGAGISNQSETLTVTNSTISGNTAGSGGGINSSGGTLTVTNSTISGNTAWGGGGTDKIRRADLDGSNVEDLVTTGVDNPTGIDLDLASGKMYWTDAGTDKIQRAAH
ncbi:MAG: hypothetical protein IH974_02570 [Myxococcales bacterium]|nr:hypothetical protein [Myxococcales bacterium]